MTDWSERVDQLLFDGETVESSVDVAGGTVVVTSHRVLAFDPDGEGARYRAIDRPNVLGVERRGVSPFDFFPTAAKLGVAGALLVLVGIVLEPEALIPRPDLTSARGAGGMVRMVEGMLGLFYAVDTVALAIGALLSIVGAGMVGVQLATREERLAIDVAGEDDVLLSYGVDDATLSDLERAIDLQPGVQQPPTT